MIAELARHAGAVDDEQFVLAVELAVFRIREELAYEADERRDAGAAPWIILDGRQPFGSGNSSR